MSEQEVLHYILAQLSKTFNVQRMILFGSRAKGTARPDSDYDVVVVVESEIPYYARLGVVGNAVRDRKFPLDLLALTPKEAEESSKFFGSIMYIAETEGNEFHAQA